MGADLRRTHPLWEDVLLVDLSGFPEDLSLSCDECKSITYHDHCDIPSDEEGVSTGGRKNWLYTHQTFMIEKYLRCH